VADVIRVVVFGKQGAGKGTQCARLAEHYGVTYIATGDILRAAARSGSELGRRVSEVMESGDLVPDDEMITVVRHRLDEDDAKKGFVMEGFPRTIGQAEALADLLAPESLDVVVNLDVPTDVVLERLTGRRVCAHCGRNYSVDRPPEDDWKCDRCGGPVRERTDDTEVAIRRRLDLYDKETVPLVSWYEERGQGVTVDGVGSTDEVAERLLAAVDGHRGA
jgi:adenylate kinase